MQSFVAVCETPRLTFSQDSVGIWVGRWSGGGWAGHVQSPNVVVQRLKVAGRSLKE